MASTDNSAGEQAQTTASMPIYDAAAAHQHSHSCNDPSHHHHHPSFLEQGDEYLAALAAKNEMLMKRKAKKTQKQGVTRAENIPGHQGDKNIDDLLNFINGPSKPSQTNKKANKKPSTNN